MSQTKRKTSGNSILRGAFVAVSFLLQLGWILLLILELNEYSAYISLCSSLLAVIVVVKLNSRHTTSAYKTPWIILIMAMPIMGLSMFLLTQIAVSPRGIGKRLDRIKQKHGAYLHQDQAVLDSMAPRQANLARYVLGADGSPVHADTATRYFGETMDALEAMKEDLRGAEKFIFMEYFILEEGQAFGQLREILEEKAAQGVEVRLMYDDVGSIGKANLRYARELNQRGIHCRPFNSALPVFNLFLNNRDHRKITVIDGKVGYTGGFNLAEEYFHYTQPFGKWKDTALRLEGRGVRNLTATFLELWNVSNRTNEDPAPYLDTVHAVIAPGMVQPFGDSPLDDKPVAEDVYLSLIGMAEKTVWFMTPYLIITDEMSRCLELAAKRGVDVRLITPGVPDKKTVYAVTRSYYARLVRQGVRVFEYTPGFCHGKMCLCDGQVASIGTSNLDFRSLYLHFENNVLLYGGEAVAQMQADFEEMFPQCREVTEKYRSVILKTWQCILRLFAPML